MAPPVAPKPKLLPFHDPNFSWETFESFFCDFLAAHPELVTKDGTRCRVVSAHPYGRRGDSQHGIDIRCEMSNGEVWVFQCKHYKDWGPKKTSRAIEKCSYDADRKFLLVTKFVSPESREVIAEHPEWELWDAGDISREFLQRLAAAEAARILYANFGRGWPEELLGISGSSPLVTAEAKFAPLLRPDRSFHHRLAMVGRREWLQDLDGFTADNKARVFFLVGPGGIGKSRLLYEWSRDFAQRHKGWTLRFVSDSPGDFAVALDGTPKPLVLVFDDAHRFDEIRRTLISQLPARDDVKLILALRPGPTDQIQSELVQSGFDTTQLRRPRAMRRLNSEQALELAEAALGPELAGRFRLPLRSLSRDVPLLAILAAELLKRGELAEKALTDTDEFRTHVFEGLLREARPVEERFGSSQTRDLLRLIAVLAPVRVDTEFLKRAAALLGAGTQPNHVSDILSALDNAGLILTTGAGIRVSPDLLSDHLAYTACYDKSGRNTAFAERVMQHFPTDQFPRFLQHVAEAEWRALNQKETADSVVEPLWQAFVAQFEAGSFYARGEKLKTWANIAHLQPQRTLALAQLALERKTAPPEPNQWVRTERWDSHAVVLERLPGLLKPLAIHHPEHVAPVLDILWQLGRDQPAPRFNSQGHPITTIGEIAGFQLHKPWAVSDEAIQWLERLFHGDDWIGRKNHPEWILQETLQPFFRLAVDETWQTGNTITSRSIPLPLDRTDKYRDRALAIIRAITKRGSVALTLATLNIIQHAMRFAYLGIATVTEQFHERWLVERKKALAVLADIIRNSTSALIHFRARRILLMEMRYKNADLRSASREVLRTIPETAETRLVRAVLGSYWDDFEGRGEGWQDHAKKRWNFFLTSVAEELVSASPDASLFLDRLGKTHAELTDLGAEPGFWPILNRVAERHPGLALAAANELLRRPNDPLGSLIDALLIPTTSHDLDLGMSMCEAALAAGSEELTVGAIGSFTHWRQEGELPPRAWELLSSCAGNATPWIANAIIRFVWLNGSKSTADDWRLLAALPADRDPGFIARGIMERASHLIDDGSLPTPEVTDAILAKLDRLDSLSGHEIKHGLDQLAKHFPGKVFLLIWRRHTRAQQTEEEFELVPFDFEHTRLDGIMDDPDAAEVIHALEDRLLEGAEMRWDETQLLQIAILQSRNDGESRLLELVHRAEGDKQLLRICEFVALWHRWPVVLSCPQFTRALLVKAKATGEEIHRKLFRKLQSLPGSRGSSGNQPNEEWNALLEAVEKLAEQYKDDTELGPLYANAAKHEREFMKDMCRRRSDDDDLFDE
jgi:hypothetical protein